MVWGLGLRVRIVGGCAASSASFTTLWERRNYSRQQILNLPHTGLGEVPGVRVGARARLPSLRAILGLAFWVSSFGVSGF